MNVNDTRTPRPARMEEAPGPRPTVKSPAEVLAMLEPTHEEPRPLLIGSLWKMGPEPQGAVS